MNKKKNKNKNQLPPINLVQQVKPVEDEVTAFRTDPRRGC